MDCSAETVVQEWMVNNMRLMDVDNYCKNICLCNRELCDKEKCSVFLAPTIDAVPVEQFNDIREDFIDYVCSGVRNPAPYCGNATEKCVDARGWCVNNECNGFTPRGERKE